MEFLKYEHRIVYDDETNDSAVIIFPPENLQLPKTLIDLFLREDRLPIGAEVGWLGFPAIGTNTLCFFLET
jgi:hypothetical protein